MCVCVCVYVCVCVCVYVCVRLHMRSCVCKETGATWNAALLFSYTGMHTHRGKGHRCGLYCLNFKHLHKSFVRIRVFPQRFYNCCFTIAVSKSLCAQKWIRFSDWQPQGLRLAPCLDIHQGPLESFQHPHGVMLGQGGEHAVNNDAHHQRGVRWMPRAFGPRRPERFLPTLQFLHIIQGMQHSHALFINCIAKANASGNELACIAHECMLLRQDACTCVCACACTATNTQTPTHIHTHTRTHSNTHGTQHTAREVLL